MNDEYLWKKTGQDDEIAKLEDTLAVFRYRETAPPALPIQLAEKPRRWRFTFALAFAGAAAAVIAVSIWIQIPDASDTNGPATAFVLDAGTQERVPNEIKSVPEPGPAPVAPARPTARPERARNYAPTPLIVRARKTKPSGLARLTKEERYAYGSKFIAAPRRRRRARRGSARHG